MTDAEKSLIIQSDKAHQNYEGILLCRANIQAGFLMLARLLKENRDDGLWKLLGHDSFEGFLGSPEVGFSRAKAYGLIHLYELYVGKLGVEERELLEIGTAKLLMVANVVENDKEGWLGKAKALSKSDLLLELGRGPGKTSPPKSSVPATSPDGCCICGANEWERSHFPVTRGAGAPETHWVPMCRDCHDEFHRGAETFILKYKRNWANYYYGRIHQE